MIHGSSFFELSCRTGNCVSKSGFFFIAFLHIFYFIWLNLLVLRNMVLSSVRGTAGINRVGF